MNNLDLTPLYRYLSEHLENDSHNGFICPRCESGSGKHGTGLSLYEDGGHVRARCFKCDFSGDLIDWIEQIEGVSSVQAFERAREYDNTISQKDFSRPVAGGNSNKTHEKKNLSLSLVNELEAAQKGLEAFINSQPNKLYRGIGFDTFKRFSCGYKSDWTNESGYRSARFLIPNDSGGYLARATSSQDHVQKMKAGASGLFNSHVLEDSETVFIVEGEFDALSILDAGYMALGLGGTGNYRKLIKQLEKHSYKAGLVLVLALDNDDAGETTQKTLSEQLLKFQDIHVFSSWVWKNNNVKDANELIQYDRNAFKRALEVEYQLVHIMSKTEDIKPVEEQRSMSQAFNAVDYLDEFITAYENDQLQKPLSTGFNDLDNLLTGGFMPELYVIAGAPNTGKTALAIQLMLSLLQAGHSVSYYLLEMQPRDLIARVISNQAGEKLFEYPDDKNTITAAGLLAGIKPAETDQPTQKALLAAMSSSRDLLKNCSIHANTLDSDITLEQIQQEVQAVNTADTVVFIDYLQLLQSERKFTTDKERLDYLPKQLQRLAEKNKIPIIALSSVNRSSYSSTPAPLSISSLKESGGIEYSAGCVMGLEYAAIEEQDFNINLERRKSAHNMRISVLKNRSGACGIVPLTFYARHDLFKAGTDPRIPRMTETFTTYPSKRNAYKGTRTR